MRKRVKKGVVLGVILVLIFSLLPLGVFAEEVIPTSKTVVDYTFLDENGNPLGDSQIGEYQELRFYHHETKTYKPSVKVFYQDGTQEILSDLKLITSPEFDESVIKIVDNADGSISLSLNDNHVDVLLTFVSEGLDNINLPFNLYIHAPYESFEMYDPNTNKKVNELFIDFIGIGTKTFNPLIKTESGVTKLLSEFEEVEFLPVFDNDYYDYININKTSDGIQISNTNPDMFSLSYKLSVNGNASTNNFVDIRNSEYVEFGKIEVDNKLLFDPEFQIYNSKFEKITLKLSEFNKNEVAIDFGGNVLVEHIDGKYYIEGLKEISNTRIKVTYPYSVGYNVDKYFGIEVLPKKEKPEPVMEEKIDVVIESQNVSAKALEEVKIPIRLINKGNVTIKNSSLNIYAKKVDVDSEEDFKKIGEIIVEELKVDETKNLAFKSTFDKGEYEIKLELIEEGKESLIANKEVKADILEEVIEEKVEEKEEVKVEKVKEEPKEETLVQTSSMNFPMFFILSLMLIVGGVYLRIMDKRKKNVN